MCGSGDQHPARAGGLLINNAGILPEATANGASNFVQPAAAEDTLRTNILGPMMVIEAMLPLLRRSPAGRIVNVSTTMGSGSWHH